MPSVGDTGPLRDVLAYAPIIQALSGLMSQVGYSGDEQLVGELQAPWSDVVAAMHAALAALAALRHRQRTGRGQYVEVAQLEATTSMLGEGLLEYQMTGQDSGPRGNYDRTSPPTTTTPAPVMTNGCPSRCVPRRNGKASAGRWAVPPGRKEKNSRPKPIGGPTSKSWTHEWQPGLRVPPPKTWYSFSSSTASPP